MSKVVLDIILEPFFAEVQTDLSQCYGCEEVIYGKMFSLNVLVMFPEEEPTIKDSGLRLCESCKDLVNLNK